MSDFSSRCCLLYSDGFLKKTASANIYSARSLEDVYEVHDFQWPSTLEEARNTSKIGLELSEIWPGVPASPIYSTIYVQLSGQRPQQRRPTEARRIYQLEDQGISRISGAAISRR
jgi:hypothetical protein